MTDYVKQTWRDYDPNYPLSAARMGHIEDGIANNSSAITVNVKAYGAVGDGTTNDYTAIMAAYAAIPATGGTLFFPPGQYRFNTALAFTNAIGRPLSIVGAGTMSTILSPAFAAGDAITLTGDGATRFSVTDLSVNPTGTRNQGTYNLKIVSSTRPFVTGVVMDTSGGGLFMFDSCTFLNLVNCQGDSTNTNLSDTCLRIRASAGNVSDCFFRTGTGNTGYTLGKPCLWVTGTVTGLEFSNCTFNGAGPHSMFTVSGITSTGADFTVTTTATHDFRVGDFVVLRGMTPAAYNSQWRVATVPTGTTFTVTSTLNPGASSVNGTAESVTACALVTNEDAGSALSVNECRMTGCLFEASQTGLYGSAGLYLDGRRGNATQSGTLSGWNLTGNYYDQYATGLLVSGMKSNSANETTVNGVSVAGGVSNARGRVIHLDQAQAVTVGDFVGCVPGSVTPIDDGASVSAGLYVYAGPSAPLSQGINVSNSQFGPGRNWQAINNTPYKYGVLLDGAGIDDLVATGNILVGTTAPVGTINSALADARRWKIRDNEMSAVFPPTTAALIPSVASAATITLAAGYDTFKITGTTSISTANGGWVGRELSLVFASDLTLLTGGNLAVAANRHVRAGEKIGVVHDGTNWYVTGDPTPSLEQTALAAFGLKSSTAPITTQYGNGLTPTSQTVHFTALPLRAGDVISNVIVSVVLASAGTAPTTIKLALLDKNGNRLAVTGNLNSDAKWTSIGYKSFALGSPYTVTASDMYMVAILKDGVFSVTDVQLGRPTAGYSALNGIWPNGVAGTGQTDITAGPLTYATGNNAFWFAVN